MAKDPTFIAHWHQLIDNFHTSSQGFYQSIETAVLARAIPEIRGARVEHKEGGLASANRVYVRILRGKYAIDICAAPFGTGFFVSWWLTEPPLRFAILYTLGFCGALLFGTDIVFALGFYMGAAIVGYAFGILLGSACLFFGVPTVLWLLGNAIRHGRLAGESTVLAMPLVGWAYERIFTPPTYYSVDTAIMFQESVHRAVLEVVDCVTENKGIRALTEAERKPILKKFAASA